MKQMAHMVKNSPVHPLAGWRIPTSACTHQVPVLLLSMHVRRHQKAQASSTFAKLASKASGQLRNPTILDLGWNMKSYCMSLYNCVSKYMQVHVHTHMYMYIHIDTCTYRTFNWLTAILDAGITVPPPTTNTCWCGCWCCCLQLTDSHMQSVWVKMLPCGVWQNSSYQQEEFMHCTNRCYVVCDKTLNESSGWIHALHK